MRKDIPAAAFMGFGTGEKANVFSLALNPEGVVNGVRVQPTIGEGVDEPFTVGKGMRRSRMFTGNVIEPLEILR